MLKTRWPMAIPLAILLLGTTAWGSTIRDEARMFSPQLVQEAQRHLDRLERASRVPVVIETIPQLPGTGREAPADERRRAVNQLAKRRDAEIHDEGIYLLISKADRVISQPLIRARLESVLPLSKRDAIREAFIEGLRSGGPDEGLKQGVNAIERALDGVRVDEARGRARAGAAVPGVRRGPARGGSFLGTFLMIGLGILAVLFLLRLLGGAFGRSAGAGYPGGMGGPRPGMGPGYGPGYGGGGGGGFFSGLLGGLGGALAGNWLYDQMSGRHGETTSAGAGYPTDEPASYTDQGEEIVGAEDHGGMGGTWDDGGGTGGGDWGGGDGGGDWGGGGGDWGGGGGDWGGGDGGGGGDW